jgi:hypothetical protein
MGKIIVGKFQVVVNYIILLGLFVVMLSSCDSSGQGSSQGEEQPDGEWDGTLTVGKRGVAYSFTHGGTTEADMNLLMPAVKWFYNWATKELLNINMIIFMR